MIFIEKFANKIQLLGFSSIDQNMSFEVELPQNYCRIIFNDY